MKRLKIAGFWNGGWPYVTVSVLDIETRCTVWMREAWLRPWPFLLVLTASDKRCGFRNRFVGWRKVAQS